MNRGLSSGLWLRSLLPVIGRIQEAIRDAIVPLDEVASVLPIGGQVIEVGCGEGLLLKRIVQEGRTIVAVDLDARKVARAKSRLKPGDAVTIEVENAFDLLDRTPDGTFTLALLVDTLSSFSVEGQDRLLTSIHRVLTVDGQLIIKAIDGNVPFKTALSRLLSGFIYRVLRLSLSHGQQFTYLSATELTGKLSSLGFQVHCRHLHTERFHPIPHILVIARRGTADSPR